MNMEYWQSEDGVAMCDVSQEQVVELADYLGAETIDFLVERGVSRSPAGLFADKVRWEVEGLLDHVK